MSFLNFVLPCSTFSLCDLHFEGGGVLFFSFVIWSPLMHSTAWEHMVQFLEAKQTMICLVCRWKLAWKPVRYYFNFPVKERWVINQKQKDLVLILNLHLWNYFPKMIWQISIIGSFRRALKYFQFAKLLSSFNSVCFLFCISLFVLKMNVYFNSHLGQVMGLCFF